MTLINDTRVVRLQRVAARTGHQHSADERIVEQVTKEIVTAADVVSLPPGSLITLQRGPGSGHTEEGSILNAAENDIGGVAGGQTTSVSFNSEDGDVSANAIFVTEIDFSQTLSASGEYAINYKTFQIKTYDPVPTTVGSRIQVTYSWAPIREYLEWDPEDLIPDLEAFGIGPHALGTGSGSDAYIEAGCNIIVETDGDGYKTISLDINSLAGEGLVVDNSGPECPSLAVNIDAYQVGYDDSNNTYIIADNVQDAITEIDGYLAAAGRVRHVRKLGEDADDYPTNTIFSTDGYEYPKDQDRILVYVNGVAQFNPINFTELSTSSIQLAEQVDHDDVVDILILPGSLGGGFGGTTSLQNAYDNSTYGSKTIVADEGQITITQPASTGSALRLISSGSVAPSLIAENAGSGEAVRFKSVDASKATLLIQKDTTARNTVVDSLIVERSTSHVSGGQTGIGSGILTRLEDTGGNLFSASKIITGTENATDSAEKSYLSIELSDDGVLTEHFRFASTGQLGIKTNSPTYDLHVNGDGYFLEDLEIGEQLKINESLVAPLNLPILDQDPLVVSHGDAWITDIGGTRKINVRISGTTYSVELT